MASEDTKQTRLKTKSKNPCFLIRKLVSLMEHPVTEHENERHLKILNEFLNVTSYAFWLHDISYIIRLYENVIKKMKKISEFRKSLECLFHISAYPPLLSKTSDQIEYARDLQEYFSVFGYLIFCLHENEFKTLALKAVYSLLKPQPSNTGYYCIPFNYCKEAAEKSQLPGILTQLILLFDNNIYYLLLDVIFTICQKSTMACRKMLQENAIEYLLLRFEPTWFERESKTPPNNPTGCEELPNFSQTCCILWRLLEVACAEKIPPETPSLSAVWNLQYAFRWSVKNPSQRLNRNNLAALILKMVTVFPEMDLIRSDLLNDIIIFSSTSCCGCNSDLELNDDEIDFQFKEILWTCLNYLQLVGIGHEVYRKNEMIQYLTKLLFKSDTIAPNKKEHYCECVKIISKMIPKMILYSDEIFIQMNGTAKLIEAIEKNSVETLNLNILGCYMYCLCEIVLLKIEPILNIIVNKNSSNIIISVCNKLLASDCLTSAHQKILEHGFCILHIICIKEDNNKMEILDMSLSYLNRVINPTEKDPLCDVRAIICAIHLLWECISDTKKIFEKFLKKSGVYILLDITETFIFPVKCMTIGVLADVSRKSSSVPYFITWRKRGQTLLPMLMEIFRQKTEEVNKDGENIDRYKNSRFLSLCKKQEMIYHGDCISKAQLIMNCRNKINAIIHALKNKFKEQVHVANEHYKLFSQKLSTDDELTMLFAKNLFCLRICESWMNIAEEFQNEGIEPVDEDNEELTNKIKLIKEWKCYLRMVIQNVVDKEIQKEQFDELETYMTLKDARLSEALDALKDLRFITRCTEKMFQLRQKLRLERNVEITTSKNTNFHRTITDLPFTNIFNQTISIQSNIIYEKKEEPCPITPVSPNDSTFEFSNESDSRFQLSDQMKCQFI